MKSTRSMVAALAAIAGFAMLAMPITASAAEHHRGFVAARRQEARAIRATNAVPMRAAALRPRAFRNARAQRFVPVMPVVPARYVAPAYNYSYPTTTAYGANCSHPANYSGYQGGYQGGYGYNNSYSAAPAYAYGGGGQGNACVEAQRLANQYRRDRSTGHPAAAQDVLNAMRRAESRCNGGAGGLSSLAPVNGGGLGNLLGAQQYANYGYGNGYNNGYANPYYGNGAGSTLLPMVQQFIR